MIVDEERINKLKLIGYLIEDKKNKLPKPPPMHWYGDTFDELYDKPLYVLNNDLKIRNWYKQK